VKGEEKRERERGNSIMMAYVLSSAGSQCLYLPQAPPSDAPTISQ
jgi:hypothetical protein